MGKVIWSPAALEDVDSIAEYVARDSADQASLFVLRLLESADRLQEFPRSGRVIPEIGEDDCRELSSGPTELCIGSPETRSGSPQLSTVPVIGFGNKT